MIDRTIKTSTNIVVEDTIGTGFTESNVGFRTGRSQHQAINPMQNITVEVHKWCVFRDLKGFFNEILYGLTLKVIYRNIADEQLVTSVALQS